MIYSIYADQGEILRIVTSPESQIHYQLTEGESYIEGEVDPATHLIIDGQVVEKTKDQKDDYTYQQRQYQFPPIAGITDDLEFNQIISDFYLGRNNVNQWRIDNYTTLRVMFYPPMSEYVDAQSKLSSSDPVIQQAGQEQLDEYNRQSLAVKARFPKE